MEAVVFMDKLTEEQRRKNMRAVKCKGQRNRAFVAIGTLETRLSVSENLPSDGLEGISKVAENTNNSP